MVLVMVLVSAAACTAVLIIIKNIIEVVWVPVARYGTAASFRRYLHCTAVRYWSTALDAIVARGQGDANCRHAHNDPIFVNRASVLGDSPLGGLG